MTLESARTVFEASVLTSGLVEHAQWLDAIQAAGGNAADDEAIAAVLVRRGLLTQYQAAQLKAGRTKLTLGPYLITDWIGQGGMGQVFKAVHVVMGRICAVKVLPLEKATPEARSSFIREIRLQAGLDCPFLARAYDAGQDGNVHYLVTEFVPGADLRKLVKNQGPLNQQQAASIIMQAALGLDYAHRQGLIHRDVKPGNILVTPDCHVKLSDVGLAAWSTSVNEDPRAGKIVGTADYLSPEQIRTPLAITPASDIYSLGCTMYYCVCGKVPYPGGDTASKCRRHLHETPWHPRKFAPDLSEDLVDIIAEMMEKDPQRRVGSASEVASRLEPFATESNSWFPSMAGGPWSAPPPPADEPASPHTENEYAPPSAPVEESSVQATAAPPITAIGSLPSAAGISVGLAVGIALAIAIPLSLLIGAIIGFIVHRSLT